MIFLRLAAEAEQHQKQATKSQPFSSIPILHRRNIDTKQSPHHITSMKDLTSIALGKPKMIGFCLKCKTAGRVESSLMPHIQHLRCWAIVETIQPPIPPAAIHIQVLRTSPSDHCSLFTDYWIVDINNPVAF